jgi:hypothetical protein
MTTEPPLELIDFHDADVERIVLDAKALVIDFANFS